MSDLINTTIVPKSFTKEYLTEHDTIIFKNRELIVEKEEKGEPEDTVLRFKLGDGIRPYKDLPYISSLYSLFPDIHLYDNNYTREITIQF